MSIIFEALRKIEEEKRGARFCGPFPAPPARRGAAGSPLFARAALAAAIAAPAAAIAAILMRHGVPARPASRPAPAPPPAMEEARIEPRGIVSALDGFPRETGGPPGAPAAVHIPPLRLSGLSRSGARSWAFINDKMLKVGDSIEGAEVVEILADRVKLKSGDTVFTLTY